MSVVRSAESVCIGHPDKLCDLIADYILDDILTLDPTARVAVEVMASGRRIIVTGEITTTVRLVCAPARERRCVGLGTTRTGSSSTYGCAANPPTSARAFPPRSRRARAMSRRMRASGLATRAPSTGTPRTKRPSVCRCRSCSPTRSAAASMPPAPTVRSVGSARRQIPSQCCLRRAGHPDRH